PSRQAACLRGLPVSGRVALRRDRRAGRRHGGGGPAGGRRRRGGAAQDDRDGEDIMNEHIVGGRDTDVPGASDEPGAAAVADRLRATPADVDALRGRLATAAAGEGLVDVAYRLVDSPIGGLLRAATPDGLAYVAFEAEDSSDVL